MTENNKTCFVVMPISDQEGYDKGHFTRVYQHLIIPACEKAGFKPIRADDEVKTNYIVIDIIRKILDSDIVVCDLSAKNANVLYELGIRQAFNKKSVLIKDNRTSRIFDIQGLRTIDYDENLRIDEVQKSIDTIASSLTKTASSLDNEVNSLIQLLSIRPAEITNDIEISKESSLIMKSLNDISSRLNNLEKLKNNSQEKQGEIEVNGYPFKLGDTIFSDQNKAAESLGFFLGQNNKFVFIEKEGGELLKIPRDSEQYKNLNYFPF